MINEEHEKKLAEAKAKFGRKFPAHMPENYKRVAPKSQRLRRIEKGFKNP